MRQRPPNCPDNKHKRNSVVLLGTEILRSQSGKQFGGNIRIAIDHEGGYPYPCNKLIQKEGNHKGADLTPSAFLGQPYSCMLQVPLGGTGLGAAAGETNLLPRRKQERGALLSLLPFLFLDLYLEDGVVSREMKLVLRSL
jgi:hypothetical protein